MCTTCCKFLDGLYWDSSGWSRDIGEIFLLSFLHMSSLFLPHCTSPPLFAMGLGRERSSNASAHCQSWKYHYTDVKIGGNKNHVNERLDATLKSIFDGLVEWLSIKCRSMELKVVSWWHSPGSMEATFCFDFSVRSGQIRNLESARVSVVGQLKRQILFH